MTQQDKRSMMFSMVEQWQQSGLSQTEFARVHNIRCRKFQYWIRKHGHNEIKEAGFIQLNGLSASSISIRYPNGVELLLPSQTPAGFIKMLVNF
jgi:hypothetical protein